MRGAMWHAGVPWCPDCARCLSAARSRVAEVDGSLLEVQVRSSNDLISSQ